MDEREFLDLLYAMYSKTPGAEDQFWMYEEDEARYDSGPGTYIIWAAGAESASKDADAVDGRKFIASVDSDEAADFITAIHGSFPDIYRRVLDAFDEADRLDEKADEREQEIASLALRVQELEQENTNLMTARDHEVEALHREIDSLTEELSYALGEER